MRPRALASDSDAAGIPVDDAVLHAIDRELWLTAAAIVHELGQDAVGEVERCAADPLVGTLTRRGWTMIGHAVAAILRSEAGGPIH